MLELLGAALSADYSLSSSSLRCFLALIAVGIPQPQSPPAAAPQRANNHQSGFFFSFFSVSSALVSCGFSSIEVLISAVFSTLSPSSFSQ
ncbi:MAG: hypothetical protein L6V88_00555 [Anaerotruncus sp.]|nr:MAG: hypothetical protein L6V88_00555 [Anaerotruncus sp.]